MAPLAACAVLLAACAAPSESPPGVVSDGRYAMGTVLEITLVSGDEARARRTLEELFAEALRLERRLSSWDPESDVSRLNRSAGRGAQPVHADVPPAQAELSCHSPRHLLHLRAPSEEPRHRVDIPIFDAARHDTVEKRQVRVHVGSAGLCDAKFLLQFRNHRDIIAPNAFGAIPLAPIIHESRTYEA